MIAVEGQNSSLLRDITSFINWIVAGDVLESIRLILFGGRLIALSKKDGGIRPIVVGQVFRRLASTLVALYASKKLSSKLAPIQLGVGVSRGVEAAVHAVRRYAQHLGPDDVIVKLDFKNAFNSVRRDTVLESVHLAAPEIYNYISVSYSKISSLSFGDHTIDSAEGVQQGDPLGPLLFCIAIHPILTSCATELRIGYLDDITIGGEISTVGEEVSALKARAEELGLLINDSKTEIISLSSPQSIPFSLSGFVQQSVEESSLLGAPLVRGYATDKV